ncbi:MAG TPA: BspA family leucine-rich repeat surface protein [Candidatus Gordonibacter avicola]|nr:BspA family leucine-rich repeat surface protein [Candidatus Gordonibacter avicola]
MSGDASQFSQQVPLDQLSSNDNQNENSPVQDAGATGVSGQVAGTVPLPEGASESIASIVADGLVFEIETTANTAKLVGTAVTLPKGDLSIPASVTSGSTTYEVTSIAKEAFAKCPELTSISLPATLREVDSDAVAGCSSLKSITVSSKNEAFSASDGMLFTKDYSHLLLIPEGKEGAATIPGQTTYVPAQAFSRCLSSSLSAGDGSAEFKTLNGMLFTKDLKTLVVCPPKVGTAVVLPTETETIGEYALAGCKNLTSITALGNVLEIDSTAFVDDVKATAVVALPAGEDYDVRKAVWEAAGFQHFAEPAEPGATTRPEAEAEDASDFVFTLLDDYTLSVTWEGVEGPAATLEIPASAEINGVSYRVSTIAANAFANRGTLTSVTLPATVTSIGGAAFAGCANLTSIQLPDTLRELGERAFEATSLADIWLPSSVQSINSRAFASCESLTRIVALGTPQVADDTLAGCANLSLYCPYNADNTYPWNLGLIANNNHFNPYGLTLPQEPLTLEVDQQANLFENALAEVPEACKLSFSYAAKPISVAPDGTATAKAPGTSEVTATLTLNNKELARATRTIEVSAASETYNFPDTNAGTEKPNSSNSETGIAQLSHVMPLATDGQPTDTSDPKEGEWGNCTWVIDEQGCLTISPKLGTDGVLGSVDKSEKNIPWYTQRDLIKSLRIEEGVKGAPDSSRLFWGCVNMETADVSGFDTSDVTIMFNMFRDCSALKSLDLRTFNTSKAEDIAQMFYGASGLTYLNVSSFDTSNVKDMYNLFRGCSSLESIDVSNFDVSNVDLMFDMFYDCASLKSVDVSHFKCTNASSVYGMFYNCSSLTSLDLSSLDISSVANIGGLFYGCSNLQTLILPETSTAGATSMASMFLGCSSLTELDLSRLNTSNVQLMSNMFNGCSSLKEIDVSGFDTRNVTSMYGMFLGCSSLKRLDLSSFNTPNLQYMGYIFSKCSNLESIDVSGLNTSRVEDMYWTFDGCSKLTSIDVSNFSTDSTTSIYAMFQDCSSLVSLDISHFTTPLVINMGSLFNGCSSLHELNISNFNTSSVQFTHKMFNGCASLQSVDLSHFVTTSLTSMFSMFEGCASLTSIDLRSFDTSGVTNMRNVFRNCSNLATLRLPNDFIGPLSTNCTSLFEGCSSLSRLPEGFIVPQSVTAMDYMFKGCQSLVSLSEDFDFPFEAALSSAEPFQAMREGDTARLKTLYQGTNPHILNFDWEGQERTLVTDASGMEDGGIWQVTFKVQSSDEALGFPWETLSVIWSNEAGEIVKPDDPVLDGYIFSGWCIDEECTQPFDFSKPLTESKTLYGTWLTHGGRGTVEGALPVQPDTGEAWWHIAVDGTLSICGDGVIANFGWTWENGAPDAQYNLQYWGPHRGDVKRIAMAPTVGVAESMDFWFAHMPQLTDASRFFVPTTGVTSLGNLFVSCSLLEKLPEPFIIPDTVTAVDHAFNYCNKLSSLPAGFSLPDGVNSAAYVFARTGLTSIPEGFSAPRDLINGEGMFAECGSLKAVPTSFNLTTCTKVENLSFLFFSCHALDALPTGFCIPASLKKVTNMFFDCGRLRSLPASMKLNSLSAEALQKANTMFSFYDQAKPSSPVKTYYAGNPSDMMDAAFWSSQSRELVTSLSGEFAVTLMVSQESGAFQEWKTLPVAANAAMAEPVAPERQGFVFLGWFTSEKGDVKFDFSQPITANTTLYGLYQKASGLLPTTGTAGNHDASWELTDDGTLKIHCTEGAVIDDFGWTWNNDVMNVLPMEHWGTLRDRVKRVQMDASVRATSMAFWFAGMSSLVDATGMFIPEGVNSVESLFANCINLTDLPTNLVIPGTAKTALKMFSHCESIAALPSQLKVMDGVECVSYMFDNMASLTTLPAGFTLPDSVTDVSGLLHVCPNFKSLPAGFNIPPNVMDIASMFYECRSLEALPVGFRIPPNCLNAQAAFYCCNSLKYLPNGFTIPSSLTNIVDMFTQCNELMVLPASIDLTAISDEAKAGLDSAFVCSDPVTNQPLSYSVTTYYAGDPSHILDQTYWDSQYRTLVTDPADLPEGVNIVSLKTKLAGEQGWTDYASLLSTSEKKVIDPGVPDKFGYSFGGWYTDETFQEMFNFETGIIEQPTTLYGVFTLQVDLDVPLSAKVEVDSSGKVTPGEFDIVSNTPQKLRVSQVSSQKANGAAVLFPVEGDSAKVSLDIKLGNKTMTLPIENGSDEYIVTLAAASSGKPSVLDGSIGLNLNGAQLDYQPGEDITSLTKLTWTIEVAG